MADINTLNGYTIRDNRVEEVITDINEIKTDIEDLSANKQDTVTGGASTITEVNLQTGRALISNASGKVDVSPVTSTELSYLDNVTSNVQMQLNGKQSTVTGGASTVTSKNLTPSRALVSNADGKIAVSPVTSTELGCIDGVTSNVQTQLNGKIPYNAFNRQPTNTNLDTLIPSGANTYRFDCLEVNDIGTANAPDFSPAPDKELNVVTFSINRAGYIIQTVYGIGTPNAPTRIWTRSRYNNAWTPWYNENSLKTSSTFNDAVPYNNEAECFKIEIGPYATSDGPYPYATGSYQRWLVMAMKSNYIHPGTSSYVSQIAIGMNGEVWTRFNYTGTWTSWKSLSTLSTSKTLSASSYGNINLGFSSNDTIIEAVASSSAGWNAIPFINATRWYAYLVKNKAGTNIELAPEGTEITATIYYKKI